MKNKVAIIVGTRPEIIKMKPIVDEVEKRHELILIHTGQHYDYEMSKVFFEELRVPEPNYYLNVGAKSEDIGEIVSSVISRTYDLIATIKPDIVMVEGDTFSSFGSAYGAKLAGALVAHVEAGCRSHDLTMFEEMNRILISDIADLHFAPTKTAYNNLLREGIEPQRVFLTGHPLVDLLESFKGVVNSEVSSKLGLKEKEYYLVTIHRRENISKTDKLKRILRELNKLSESFDVIFPVHPHTRKVIEKLNLGKYVRGVNMTKPLKYIDFLSLLVNSRLVLTDSGGVQQEAFFFKVPCVTVRKSTEWVETVELGVNVLVGDNPDHICETVNYVEDNYEEIMDKLRKAPNVFGKPGVSATIVDIVEKFISNSVKSLWG